MSREWIRQMIRSAVEQEVAWGALANHLTKVSQANGVTPMSADVDDVVMLVRTYIEALPRLLDAAADAAAKAGVSAVIDPLLEAADQYFREPQDYIPDSLGLAGLTDDAYLAMGLLAIVSDCYAQKVGIPIFVLDPNLIKAHQVVRYLLGPVGARIDALLQSASQPFVHSMTSGIKSTQVPLKPPLVYKDPLNGMSASEWADKVTRLLIP